jgi:hypothetical protein
MIATLPTAHDRFRRRQARADDLTLRLQRSVREESDMTMPVRALPYTLLLTTIVPTAAHAAPTPVPTVLSSTQELDFDRPESWAMKYYTSVLLMTGQGTPRPLRLGQVRVGIEGEWIPYVSDAQRMVGFNGTKTEDLNKLPAIGRLRIQVGLGWKLSLTVSYLPPITINGVEPNLFSLSLGRPFALGRNFTLGILTYGQVGSVEAAFTCSGPEARAGGDTQKNPFGCLEPSHDHVNMNYWGAEVSASYRIVPALGLEPYASVAVNAMFLGFDVHARYDSVIDETRLRTSGATFSTTGGLLFPITRRLDITTEVFYSPLTVQRPQQRSTTVDGLFNVRGMIAYRFF